MSQGRDSAVQGGGGEEEGGGGGGGGQGEEREEDNAADALHRLAQEQRERNKREFGEEGELVRSEGWLRWWPPWGGEGSIPLNFII